MNTQDIRKLDDKDPIIILSEVCEEYPDCCDFCDYNIDGYCSLFMSDIEELPAPPEEK